MDPAQYLNAVATPGGRPKQVQEAEKMTKAVQERASRIKVPVPEYDLLELIGKGSFGRVFKSRSLKDGALVAVKIIEVDKMDYAADPQEKDQAIKDFFTETTILQQLKDSKAKNINIIHDAFDWHSQLWIVSEYCPGGSLHTLMKAGPQTGLEEQYIIPIARELAVALKHIHDIGIIHRDVKAANILITQDGQLQLCDFGVSGVLKSNTDKRSTITGTPYWMAPEMLKEDAVPEGYGVEIDIWAYGIALIEFATGLPPNANIAATRLYMFMDKAPRLEGDSHSALLKEFVEFCLKTQPSERPTAEQLLQHPFTLNTSKRYPTTILKSLIDRFYRWEQMGGQRMSLYTPNGAAAPELLDSHEADGWRFSTTEDFSFLSHSVSSPEIRDHYFDESLESTPTQGTNSTKKLTPFERATEEQRVMRGERALARLFDQNTTPYEYSESEDDSQLMSDLPFRNMASNLGANRNTLIDLDAASDFHDIPVIDLADVPTIRANKSNRFFFDDDDDDEPGHASEQDTTRRITRDWKFPSAERPKTMEWSMAMAQSVVEEVEPEVEALAPPFRPKLKHTVTEPVGVTNDYLHPTPTLAPPLRTFGRTSIIDLDGAEMSRPSTADSSFNSSVSSEWTNANPFDLDAEFTPVNRTSFHMHSQSEPPLRPSSQRSFRRSASEQHRRASHSSDDAEFDHDRSFSTASTSSAANTSSLQLPTLALPSNSDWDEPVRSHRLLQSASLKQAAGIPLFSAPPGAHFTGLDMLSSTTTTDDDNDNNHNYNYNYNDDGNESSSAPPTGSDPFRQGLAPRWPPPRIRTRMSHTRHSIHASRGRGGGGGGGGFDTDAETESGTGTGPETDAEAEFYADGDAYRDADADADGPTAFPAMRDFSLHASDADADAGADVDAGLRAGLPDPRPPHPQTLVVNADTDLVVAELTRLMADYMQGLKMARSVIGARQRPESRLGRLVPME